MAVPGEFSCLLQGIENGFNESVAAAHGVVDAPQHGTGAEFTGANTVSQINLFLA
ncbi:hypothetical protein [uncultured Microbulbifer sp.]|uniref:hypothetical protein n=1 Tax=uncultured Microbulbifer sp. TaxID=348147 RepID=UPI00261B84E7|nr:hypothetical protein [uncultured Microbulbifer sp.]